MAVTVLQTAQFSTDITTGTTVAATLTGVTAGSTIVAFVSWSIAVNPGATPSVADPSNGAYTQVGSTLSDATANQALACFLVPNSAAAGSLVVTLTLTAANRYRAITLVEIGGASTTAPLDGTNGSIQDPGPNTTDGLTSGNFSTAAAAGLLLGLSVDNFVGAPTQGTGFTNNGTCWDFNNNGGGTQYARLESKATSSAGTYATTFTGATGNGSMTIGLGLKPSGGASPSPLVEHDSPTPRATRAPHVNHWSPLAAIPPVPSVAGTFSASPTGRPLRRPPVPDWSPLPTVLVQPPTLWGFSSGTNVVTAAPVVVGWEPLGPLPATPSLRGGWDCSPLPSRLRAPRLDAWEPLPALPISSARPLVDFASPQPCRRQPPRPDPWEPLAGVVSPSVATGGWEAQAATQRQQRATAPAGWEPLAPLLGPAVDCSATPAPRSSRATPPQQWEPLPAVALPPLTAAGGFESEAPPVPARRSPIVQAWEPLAAVQAPPSVTPLGFSDAPTNRTTRPRVDAWEPLPAVTAAPPASVVACFSEPPVTRHATARLEGWSPVPSLPADALGPLVCSVVPPQPRRQQQAPGGWEPLASLTDAVGDCFSPPPTQQRQRGAMVACWEPLASITALPVPEAWGFSAQPVGRVRAARVDAWGVLAGVSASPPAIMRQQYLLQAV